MPPTLENDQERNQQHAVVEPSSLVQDHQQDEIYYEMPSAMSSPDRRNNNNGNHNNNHHVVPVGILIVLFTLYLTTAAVKRNYALRDTAEIKLEQPVTTVVSKPPVQNQPQATLTISERFLEYDHVCMDLAIFTKDLDISKHHSVVVNTKSSAQKVIDRLVRGKGSVPHKQKRGSGHRYNNKSTSKSKHAKKIDTTIANNNKKEQQAKKNTTAEPIIYLFALVFIYLLLKAASDINQHYKQAKGDKRLRRCSLQSYAQTHKQDRRASKDSPLLQPILEPQHLQHELKQRLMEFRSKSVDRCINPAVQSDSLAKNAEIFANLRKYTSVDETQVHGRHFRKLLGGEFGPCSAAEHAFSTSMNRRCSVPVSLIPQGGSKIISTMHPLQSLSSSPRRMSIASGSIGTHGGAGGSGGLESLQGSVDAQFPEIKRRVRMINRH